MNLSEYSTHDAIGLAELVSTNQVTPKELAETAARAIEAVNPKVNAVVETYPDRIEGLDDTTLGNAPFRGVPFLIHDGAQFGPEAARRLLQEVRHLAIAERVASAGSVIAWSGPALTSGD